MTKMAAYYNENDPFAAQWLRNLIASGKIAPGEVDERSIEDVRPDDHKSYTQCHFFAGIGGWAYALQIAGWPDYRPVWTGSCPCQPFSQAGKGDGFADERHLWPQWHHLIKVMRPSTIFGEQTASADGLMWIDLVQDDLEGEEYAVGASDLCSAGVGAPNIRQRLFWVAESDRAGLENGERAPIIESPCVSIKRHCGGMGNANSNGCASRSITAAPARLWDSFDTTSWNVDKCKMLNFIDGKRRPVKPGIKPVAARLPGHVGKIRGFGNAINPQVAATFIRAFLDVT